MDKIFIHALKAEAIIGIYDWERQVRQTVLVDIEIGADMRKAALTDSIDDTLNYKRVAKRVLALIEASAIPSGGDARRAHGDAHSRGVRCRLGAVVLAKPGAVRSSRDVGVELERDRPALESWLAARARALPIPPGT